jgi:ComF family protein
MCTVCGEPFASRQGVDHPCADCRRGRFSFDSARSVGIYSGALKALIHAFKYRGMAHLTAPLGRLMWERMSSIKEMGDADGFVSVPLHPRRKRRRGFNQARLLMQAWPAMAAKEGGRPGLSEISAGLLIRARATRPQTGLDPRQRRANLRDAFRVRGNRSLEGRKLVIVDDVMTTGATADACARVLKRAGAASVNVFTLARAV